MPNTEAPFVLIDDARGGRDALLFSAPRAVISCTEVQDVDAALAALDQALKDGYHVAGFMSYELGYALEPKLAPLMPKDAGAPLIWMGVFDAPQHLNQDALRAKMTDWETADCEVELLEPLVTREAYLAHVERVLGHILAGDVYQINYTFKQPFKLSGSARALYARLRGEQRAAYGALVATGERHVLSLSPELFVEAQGQAARTRPMKGTAPRAADPAEDARLARWLNEDEKSRAENLMIVDLLRNDLGRIAEVGSVKVKDLFAVETYPTVHQMTSTVEGRLRPGTALSDMVRALFPCGSVTGAPKVKAMEIIHDLEDAPRGIYTGAVGYAAPGEFRFNVAIRTLDIAPDGHGELGIGSGVVYDSQPQAEWEECHLKAEFLTRPTTDFELLETLKWERATGFALLGRHLARLERTANYFGYPYDERRIVDALEACVAAHREEALRLRLTVDAWGAPQLRAQPLSRMEADAVWRYAIAPEPIDARSPFTFHKTTNRAFYDDARERLKAETGCDEVLFRNAKGELTEGSITNLFVERGGELLTPPTACGLLAGTLRAELLESGRARESVLTETDLLAPNRVFLGNSVRGLIKAQGID